MNAALEVDSQRFVTAMSRGLDVLRVFADADEWLGNGEIALRAGLPKSTVSRATYTLTQMHFLDADPVEHTYRLGAAVLELAGKAGGFESLRRVMRPYLQTLASLALGSTGAAYLSGAALHYFEYCRSEAAVGLSLQVGSTVPVLGSAVGKAYLAAVTDGEWARLSAQMERSDPASLETLLKQRRAAVQEYQADGYCRAYGTWKQEVNTIAVPYRVPCSGLLIALSLAGPAYSLTAQMLDGALSVRLKASVLHIDQEFGRNSIVKSGG